MKLQRFKEMKVKYQIFSLLTILLSVCFILTIGLLEYSFSIYDELLYKQSGDMLNVFVGNIDKELSEIERISFSSMVDLSIQRGIEEHMNSTTLYDKIDKMKELQGFMYSKSLTKYYIDLLAVMDGNGDMIFERGKEIEFDVETKKQLTDVALSKRGSNGWVILNNKSNKLLSVREIKKVEQGDFKYLGIMMICIDMDKLVRQSSDIEKKDGYILITADNNLVYSSSEKIKGEDLKSLVNEKNSYEISDINGQQYFTTKVASDYTNWKYISMIPFAGVTKGINSTRDTMFLLFMIAWMGIVFLAVRFAKNITKPVELLSAKIKDIEKGNFSKIEFEDVPIQSNNEMHTLFMEFNIMTQKIESLINENYVKQLALKDSQLKMLQLQINPHFLYNTLESINWMAKMNGHQAISLMVRSLGKLLRTSLDNKDYLITINDEMQLISDYIAIQKIRYEDRLEFNMQIPEELQVYTIPKLSLQPIVENSITYALEKIPDICKITIRGQIEDDTLKILVSDNGQGISEDIVAEINEGRAKPKGTGIGLKNVDGRIKIAYGDNYGIRLFSEINKGTTVVISLPLNFKD